MAWTEGTMAQAAGSLLAILDVDLVANAKWSIYDAAAGTNAKVYRCQEAAENVDYYVKVDDNYANYAIVELWEGWDAVGHAGTGSSLTAIRTYLLYIRKPAGGYGIAVGDHRFIWVNRVSGQSYYIGQLIRYDTTKNIPIAIVNLTSGSLLNPIGYYDSAAVAGWACLFDETGTVGRTLGNYGGNSNLYVQTIASTIAIFGSLVINGTTNKIMGYLDGAQKVWTFTDGLSDGQTITLSGIDWLIVVGNTYCNLIRKS